MSKWAPVPGHHSTSGVRTWFWCFCFLSALTLTSCSGCNHNKGADTDGSAASDSGQSVGAHYERNDGKERGIVFVHGIYASAAGTWTCRTTGLTRPQILLSPKPSPHTHVY